MGKFLFSTLRIATGNNTGQTLHSGSRVLGFSGSQTDVSFGKIGFVVCCSIVVDGCIKFHFLSIFLQRSGSWDAGAEGGGRIPSFLQHISAIATGQVKLPLYTGPALSRLALFLMVHLDNLVLVPIRVPSEVPNTLLLSEPADALPSYSDMFLRMHRRHQGLIPVLSSSLPDLASSLVQGHQ